MTLDERFGEQDNAPDSGALSFPAWPVPMTQSEDARRAAFQMRVKSLHLPEQMHVRLAHRQGFLALFDAEPQVTRDIPRASVARRAPSAVLT